MEGILRNQKLYKNKIVSINDKLIFENKQIEIEICVC